MHELHTVLNKCNSGSHSIITCPWRPLSPSIHYLYTRPNISHHHHHCNMPWRLLTSRSPRSSTGPLLHPITLLRPITLQSPGRPADRIFSYFHYITSEERITKNGEIISIWYDQVHWHSVLFQVHLKISFVLILI